MDKSIIRKIYCEAQKMYGSDVGDIEAGVRGGTVNSSKWSDNADFEFTLPLEEVTIAFPVELDLYIYNIVDDGRDFAGNMSCLIEADGSVEIYT